MPARFMHNRRFFSHPLILLSCVAIATVTASSRVFGADAAPTDDDSRELERARREIKLLDDIYKTAIVLITKHYVEETPTCRPAKPSRFSSMA